MDTVFSPLVKANTTQRRPVASEGQAPFAYQVLIQEPKKARLRRISPCVSSETTTLVLDNFYKRGWTIPKIKRVFNLRYEVVESILRAVYHEVTPPSGGKAMKAAA